MDIQLKQALFLARIEHADLTTIKALLEAVHLAYLRDQVNFIQSIKP